MNKQKQIAIKLKTKNLTIRKRIKHCFNVLLGRPVVILGDVEIYKKNIR